MTTLYQHPRGDVGLFSDRKHRPFRSVLAAVAGLALLMFMTGCSGLNSPPEHPQIRVTKLASCGCCRPWVKYLQDNGFRVEVTDVPDMTPLKNARRIPLNLQSCHTAEIGGYIIEGHVSAEEIRRVLKERPKIRGLFVPGMPTGAPGQEGPTPVRYDVLALNPDGTTYIFATHDPSTASTAASPPVSSTDPVKATP